jgi:nitroreductase
MLEKPAATSYALHPLLRERWSPRSFDLQPVPREQILTVMEAARWSPSGGNGQPWSFVVIPRADQGSFERAISCLNEGNVVWAQHAPLLILTVAQVLRENGAPNRTALYDLGQAVAHLSVQATALGLWVHQMAGFSQDRARELFAVPDGYEPVTFIALGQQGDHATLPETLREREQAPRTRKPIEAFVFGEAWGQPSPLLDGQG